MKPQKLIFIIILLLSTVFTLFADEKSGSLSGWITDKETKKPIVGVAIMVDDSVRYQIKSGMSDAKGRYIIHNIPIGSHQITFSRIGYQTQTKTNIIVKPNRNTILNVGLHYALVKLAGITVRHKQFFKEIPDAPVILQKVINKTFATKAPRHKGYFITIFFCAFVSSWRIKKYPRFNRGLCPS